MLLVYILTFSALGVLALGYLIAKVVDKMLSEAKE